mmetsp:Transcript_35810/g.80600  ORF Transcript_35810/g.80600 Transcript_35810/m.80600 type:complete len:208 (-) Transcript_35810:69-692(-)
MKSREPQRSRHERPPPQLLGPKMTTHRGTTPPLATKCAAEVQQSRTCQAHRQHPSNACARPDAMLSTKPIKLQTRRLEQRHGPRQRAVLRIEDGGKHSIPTALHSRMASFSQHSLSDKGSKCTHSRELLTFNVESQHLWKHEPRISVVNRVCRQSNVAIENSPPNFVLHRNGSLRLVQPAPLKYGVKKHIPDIWEAVTRAVQSILQA